eukprot:COSAG05_NODE_5_length_47078_cov_547.868814_18_plen_176_part_00
MGWSLDRFFYRSMTPSSAPRDDSDLKSKYCFCAHMHEMMKYFLFTEIHEQCLNQLSAPSWESSICRRIDRSESLPLLELKCTVFRPISGIYIQTLVRISIYSRERTQKPAFTTKRCSGTAGNGAYTDAAGAGVSESQRGSGASCAGQLAEHQILGRATSHSQSWPFGRADFSPNC